MRQKVFIVKYLNVKFCQQKLFLATLELKPTKKFENFIFLKYSRIFTQKNQKVLATDVYNLHTCLIAPQA